MPLYWHFDDYQSRGYLWPQNLFPYWIQPQYLSIHKELNGHFCSIIAIPAPSSDRIKYNYYMREYIAKILLSGPKYRPSSKFRSISKQTHYELANQGLYFHKKIKEVLCGTKLFCRCLVFTRRNKHSWGRVFICILIFNWLFCVPVPVFSFTRVYHESVWIGLG